MNRSGSRKGEVLARAHAESAAEFYFRVLIWLQGQRKPTWQAVAERFEVDRATAFRYLAAWRRATGQPAAPHSGGRPKQAAAEPPVSHPGHAGAREAVPADHPWNRRHAP